MRLVSFLLDGEAVFGALEEGEIVPFGGTADNRTIDLKTWLASGDDPARGLEAPSKRIPVSQVQFLAPIPNPGKVLCVATNFLEAATAGKPVPDYPLVFTRFADTFVGHQAPIIKPAVSTKFDFEGELAVVIGRPAFRVGRSEAMGHVAGYCCLNDGSARDWQKHSSQFTPGKNFYRSGSMGPWMTTVDDVADPSALHLQTRVNGEVKQEISLDRMIFDIPWLISYLSTFTPLQPGDVIATGTPSGFGSSREPQEFLGSGDVVEVEISGVGTLRNAITDEA